MLIKGREIVFEAENDAPPEEVAIFLLGTVFGVLLHQREQIVLHASAVRVNGKAVLFCGPSGAGKSTVAAALAQRGYPLVTDDFCTLTAAGSGAPLVHPDGRKLKLWAQAIERLDLDRRRGDRVRRSLEKFYVEPGEASTEPLALGACLCSARSATTAQSGDRAAQSRRRSAAAARQRLPAVAGAAHGAINRQAVYCAQPGRLDPQLRHQVPGWSGHIASWLDQSDIPVRLIRYEDMQADADGVFRRALDFAGRPASDEDIRRAVRHADFAELRRQEEDKGFSETPRRPGGLFFRRGEVGGWRDELSAGQVARIEAAHAEMMRRLGYEPAGAMPLARTGVGTIERIASGEWRIDPAIPHSLLTIRDT